MTIIKSPWRNLFFELVRATERSIKVTSPFVKENVVNDILGSRHEGVKIDLVTSFKLANFYNGASDLTALDKVIRDTGNVYNVHKLHSKVYLFDDVRAVITSGNLTNGGLLTNYEYGVLIEEPKKVAEVVSDFGLLCSGDNTGVISLQEIGDATDILAKLPKREPLTIPELPNYQPEDTSDIFTGNLDTITNTLDGWKLEVFKCLQEIGSEVFTLANVHVFVPKLQRVFPNNNNIEAKIRQQLQYLRDIGLVEFLGRGVYRKLWA